MDELSHLSLVAGVIFALACIMALKLSSKSAYHQS